MMQAEQLRKARVPRRGPLAAACAALSLGLVLSACDDNRDQSKSGTATDQAQNTRPATPPDSATPNTPPPPRATPARPPDTAPGAGPSAERIVGTWTVTEAKGGPATSTAKGDKIEGTTYRFEAGGKVTVAGAKQCTYALQPAALEVKCGGTAISGAIEFREKDQTIVWTVGQDETVTLKKR